MRSTPYQLRVSELAFIEDCRQRWWWENEWLVAPTGPATFVGSAVHAGLEAYYRHDRSHAAARQAIADWLQQFRKDTDDRTDLDRLFIDGQARQLLENFLDHEEHTPLEGKILGVELRLKQTILPDVIELSGMIDLVLEDEYGGIWIVDHKTFGDWSMNQRPDILLDIDEQLTGYAYLAWKHFGKIPEGVIYNIMTKKTIMPPVLLKSGKLSKDKSQATTAKLYRESVIQHGLNMSDYEEIISYFAQNEPQLIVRESSGRTEEELIKYEQRLERRARQVRGLIDYPERRYPSPSIYKCNYCPFIAACKTEMEGGDSEEVLSRFGRNPESILLRQL